MKQLVLVAAAILFVMVGVSPLKIYQWRGDNRDGVYAEKNLQEKWSETGPELLWKFNGIGNGYGSPL